MVHAQGLERLIGAPAITRNQTFEVHRRRSKTARFGRRPPLAPQPITPIQEQTLDDDGDVGGETAAALEPTENLAVPVEEVNPYIGSEVFRIARAQPMPAADLRGYVVDDGQIGGEQSFVSHKQCRAKTQVACSDSGRPV